MKEFFEYFIKYLFSTIITALSLILLIATYYKSEIVYDGNLRDYYIQYFIVSLLLFIFSVISFFLNQEAKKNILTFFSSIFLVLYTLDISLFFYDMYKVKKTKTKISKFEDKKNFDQRSRLEVYEELKKNDPTYVITLSPQNYINDDLDILPLSGISNSPSIFCNESGYYSVYLSDRFGFNNEDNDWNNETIDFLIVGDSFAQGACVNRPNDITSILKKLSGKNIINIGYGGNGPLTEYAALREYSSIRKVKNVIWLFFSNDINDLNSEYKNKILKKYLKDKNFSQNLAFKQNIIDELALKKLNSLKKKEEKKKNFDFYGFLKLNNLRDLIQFKENKNFDQIKKTLSFAKELIEQKNGNFYFIYLPSFDEINSKKISSDKLSMDKIIEQLEIKNVNIYDFIKQKKNSLDFFPYQKQGHYSKFGYKEISQKIFNEIF